MLFLVYYYLSVCLFIFIHFVVSLFSIYEFDCSSGMFRPSSITKHCDKRTKFSLTHCRPLSSPLFKLQFTVRSFCVVTKHGEPRYIMYVQLPWNEFRILHFFTFGYIIFWLIKQQWAFKYKDWLIEMWRGSNLLISCSTCASFLPIVVMPTWK